MSKTKDLFNSVAYQLYLRYIGYLVFNLYVIDLGFSNGAKNIKIANKTVKHTESAVSPTIK